MTKDTQQWGPDVCATFNLNSFYFWQGPFHVFHFILRFTSITNILMRIKWRKPFLIEILCTEYGNRFEYFFFVTLLLLLLFHLLSRRENAMRIILHTFFFPTLSFRPVFTVCVQCQMSRKIRNATTDIACNVVRVNMKNCIWFHSH